MALPLTNHRPAKLLKAVSVLENSLQQQQLFSIQHGSKNKSYNSTPTSSAAALEKDRRACLEIRHVLSSWDLSEKLLGRDEARMAMSILFMCLDHREATIRLLADASIDAIFRKLQLKFQALKPVVTLLIELSRPRASARTLCAAFAKLAACIHHHRAHRAALYALHFMNAVCMALKRSEEAVQLAVERHFPTIFSQLGPHVNPTHVEKAEELYQIALARLDCISAAANRAACLVIAQLAHYVPPLLHKSFYKLSSIVLEPFDDAVALPSEKARLAGALTTFRLMWWTAIVPQLADFSLVAIRRLLTKFLCCLYSKHSDVVVAAMELLTTAMGGPAMMRKTGGLEARVLGLAKSEDNFPGSLFHFNPLLIEDGGSPFRYPDEPGPISPLGYSSMPEDSSLGPTKAEEFNPKEDEELSASVTLDDKERGGGLSAQVERVLASEGASALSISGRSAWGSTDDLASFTGLGTLDEMDDSMSVATYSTEQGMPSFIAGERDADTLRYTKSMGTRSCSTSDSGSRCEEDRDENMVIVDPLLNSEGYERMLAAAAGDISAGSDGKRDSDASLRWNSSGSGSLTPVSLSRLEVSDYGGGGMPEMGVEEGQRGVPDHLPEDFEMGDDRCTFYEYSFMLAARRFLLPPRGGATTRGSTSGAIHGGVGEVRVSWKILALNYLSALLPHLHTSPTGKSEEEAIVIVQKLGAIVSELYDYVHHDDDALTMAAVGVAVGWELSRSIHPFICSSSPYHSSSKSASARTQNFLQFNASKLHSALIKVLRPTAHGFMLTNKKGVAPSANRLKSLLNLFTVHLPQMEVLFATCPEDGKSSRSEQHSMARCRQLSPPLISAIELALSSSVAACDYFLVKVAKIELLGAINWQHIIQLVQNYHGSSPHARKLISTLLLYQRHCVDCMIRQLLLAGAGSLGGSSQVPSASSSTSSTADPRVVKASCDALVKFVEMATPREHYFHHHHGQSSRCGDPHSISGFEALPPVSGLDTDHFAGLCQLCVAAPTNSAIPALSFVLQRLYSISMERWSQCYGGFLAGVAALTESYPPSLHPGSWALLWGVHEQSSEIGSQWFTLLFELADFTLFGMVEWTNLLRVLPFFVAATASEGLYRIGKERVTANGGISPSATAEARSQVGKSPALLPSELSNRLLLFYMRLLNLYYCVVAEERTSRANPHQSPSRTPAAQKSEAAQTPRSSASSSLRQTFASVPSPLSLLPSPRFFSGGANEATESPTPTSSNVQAAESKMATSSRRSPSSHQRTHSSTRMHSLSHLVGSGLKPALSTSYTYSPQLCSLEQALRTSYRQHFVEALVPEQHQRFALPYELAMRGFATLLEVTPIEVLVDPQKRVLEELLLYLRALFDVSVEHSARLVHQLLKALFHCSGGDLCGKALETRLKWRLKPVTLTDNGAGTMTDWEGGLDFNRSIEQASTLLCDLSGICGFLCPDPTLLFRPIADESVHLERIASSLQLFEPFINRLLHIYPLTKSVQVRRNILATICTLVSNSVRYEMMDPGRRFLTKALARMHRRDSQMEDVELLPTIFTFLLVLTRASVLDFNVVLAKLAELYSALDEQNVNALLEATQIVLVEEMMMDPPPQSITPQGGGPPAVASCSGVGKLLAKEFDFLFTQQPARTAYQWLLLLSSLGRHSGNTAVSAVWEEMSEKFVNQLLLIGEKTSPTVHRPGGEQIYHLLTVALSFCSMEVISRHREVLVGRVEAELHGAGSEPHQDTDLKFPYASLREDSRLETLLSRLIPFVYALVKCESMSANQSEKVDGEESGTSLRLDKIGRSLQLSFERATMCLRAAPIARVDCEDRERLERALAYLISMLRTVGNRQGGQMGTILGALDIPCAINTHSNLQQQKPYVNERVEKDGDESKSTAQSSLMVNEPETSEIEEREQAPEKEEVPRGECNSAMSTFQLYFTLAVSSTSPECHEQICAMLPAFNRHEIVLIVKQIPAAHRLDFLGEFLRHLLRTTRALNAECFLAAENASNKKQQQPDSGPNKLHSSSIPPASMELLAAIAKLIAEPQLLETNQLILLLGGCYDFSIEFEQRLDPLILPKEPSSLERLINDALILGLLRGTAGCYPSSVLPSAYYKAVQVIFTSPQVLAIYGDDYHCLVHLQQYITALWEFIEGRCNGMGEGGHVNPWEQLNKPLWRVEIHPISAHSASCIAKVETHREDILRLFSIVQAIVEGMRLVKVRPPSGWSHFNGHPDVEEVQAIEKAFQSLLRIPLLNRMACVPRGMLLLGSLPDDTEGYYPKTSSHQAVSPETSGGGLHSSPLPPAAPSIIIEVDEQSIHLPLIPIQLLVDEPDALNDFTARVLWLGWTSRQRFEECWSSLLGVLSTPPPTPNDTPEHHSHRRTAIAKAQPRPDANSPQKAIQTTIAPSPTLIPSPLAASPHPHHSPSITIGAHAAEARSHSIDSLTAMLVQMAQLRPQPGNPATAWSYGSGKSGHSDCYGRWARRYREQYPFLDTLPNGRAAAVGKQRVLQGGGHPSGAYLTNLETLGMDEVVGSSIFQRGYSLGQCSVRQLRERIGMLEKESDSPASESPIKGSPGSQEDSSPCAEPPLVSTTLDTSSALKALFDCYIHWCRPLVVKESSTSSSGTNVTTMAGVPPSSFDHMPINLLSATVRSMALLSDLFDDAKYYWVCFAKLRALHHQRIVEAHPSSGYVIYTLLKCAAVVEWDELVAESGETANVDTNNSGHSATTEVIKLLEELVHEGLLSAEQHCSFVRECTLRGVLHLVESRLSTTGANNPALCLLLIKVLDFALGELLHCSQPPRRNVVGVDYQRLMWALCFEVLEHEAALPVDVAPQRESLLQLAGKLFTDSKLPTWLKEVLTGGLETLVIHSCPYATRFRELALECLETYQLRPAHLPYALSLYLTCTYRELGAGGEYAYAVNKGFMQDFQKLLNIVASYASSGRMDRELMQLNQATADLICMVWAKEAVIENVWNLIVPPTTPSPPRPAGSSSSNTQRITSENSDQDEMAKPPVLGGFDRALLHLLHRILLRLAAQDAKSCVELCTNTLFPKLQKMATPNTPPVAWQFARLLGHVILCSVSTSREVHNRIHLLLIDSSASARVPFAVHTSLLVDSFFAMMTESVSAKGTTSTMGKRRDEEEELAEKEADSTTTSWSQLLSILRNNCGGSDV